MIPVILGVLLIVFALSAITPGDPVDQIVGSDAAPEVKEAMREKMGLNDPFLVRYGRYLIGIVTRGDFGTSYATGEPVAKEIFQHCKTDISGGSRSTHHRHTVGCHFGSKTVFVYR